MPIGLLSRISPRVARLVIFAIIAGGSNARRPQPPELKAGWQAIFGD